MNYCTSSAHPPPFSPIHYPLHLPHFAVVPHLTVEPCSSLRVEAPTGRSPSCSPPRGRPSRGRAAVAAEAGAAGRRSRSREACPTSHPPKWLGYSKTDYRTHYWVSCRRCGESEPLKGDDGTRIRRSDSCCGSFYKEAIGLGCVAPIPVPRMEDACSTRAYKPSISEP